MSLDDKIRATIDGYFEGFAKQDIDLLMGLFSDDPSVEDPVGTPPHKGRDAVKAFYSGSLTMDVELTPDGPYRIIGHEAMFPFWGLVTFEGTRMKFEVIDHMTFDDNGKIKTMRAYFGPSNMSPAEA